VVLRSYDTRLRPTSRSPDFCLRAKVKESYDKAFEEETNQLDLPTLGRPLLYLANDTASDHVHNFGDISDIPQVVGTHQDLLWYNNGKLQLIETAFQQAGPQNAHEAQKPGDFIPIINHLLHLHEQNFVHGDIRAFNIVFNGNDGKLIDFDLSGEAGEKRYPPGYMSTLPDAIRCGHALSLIEKHHDWYALGNVIFIFHEFQEPDKLSEEDKVVQFSEIYKMSFRIKRLGAEDSSLVSDLKGFLKLLDSNGWTCKATSGTGLYYYYHEHWESKYYQKIISQSD
jgi:serine/threonine protein kinase